MPNVETGHFARRFLDIEAEVADDDDIEIDEEAEQELGKSPSIQCMEQ